MGSVCMLTACAGFNSLQKPDLDQNGFDDSEIKLFSSKIKSDSFDSKLIYQQAFYFLENRKIKVAATLLEDLVMLEPENVKAHNALGVAYDHLGDHNKALKCYKNSLTIDSELDYVWNNLGYSHMMANDYEAAVEAFKKAIYLENNNRKYHNNLALSYAKMGNYPLAFSEFVAGGGVLRAHYNLAKIYYSNGEYEKARKHFDKVLKINSTDNKSRNGSIASMELTVISKTNIPNGRVHQTKKSGSRVYQKQTGYITPSSEHSKSKDLYAAQSGPKSRQNQAEFDLIEVSNGNGIEGMANRVRVHLKKNGYQDIRISNANHFNHLGTVIFYEKDYLHVAYEIAKQIPGMQIMKKIDMIDGCSSKIKILLGKDIIIHDKYFNKTERS